MEMTWHTVALIDRETGERFETAEKAIDQDDANQRVVNRITDGDLIDLGLLVIID